MTRFVQGSNPYTQHATPGARDAGDAGDAGDPVGRIPCPGQGCLRRPLATTTLRDDDGFISMPVTIGGQSASMLVDTGSDSGLLTEAGAARLGLARDRQRRTLMQGTGGTSRVVPNVLYPGIDIGGLSLPDGSLPMSSLPAMPVVSPSVAG